MVFPLLNTSLSLIAFSRSLPNQVLSRRLLIFPRRTPSLASLCHVCNILIGSVQFQPLIGPMTDTCCTNQSTPVAQTLYWKCSLERQCDVELFLFVFQLACLYHNTRTSVWIQCRHCAVLAFSDASSNPATVGGLDSVDFGILVKWTSNDCGNRLTREGHVPHTRLIASAWSQWWCSHCLL